MVSSWRKSKNEERTSLLVGKPSSSALLDTTTPRKKGLFGRRSDTYQRTPPVTPEDHYDVAVVASEYDPSRPYDFSRNQPSAPYPSTPMRKVEFKPQKAPPAFPPPQSYPSSIENSNSIITEDVEVSVNTVNVAKTVSSSMASSTEEPKHFCPSNKSMFTQTLGLIDDICLVPRPEEKRTEPQWGKAPTREEEESSFTTNGRSFPSTTENFTEYSKSHLTSYASTGTQEEPQEDDSVEHENFEVVLEPASLASPVPQKSGDSRRSLVKRLFSGRNKKNETSKTHKGEPQDPDGKYEEGADDDAAVIAGINETIDDPLLREEDEIAEEEEVVQQVKDQLRAEHLARDPPSSQQQLSPADEILSSISAIGSLLGYYNDEYAAEEEKKEEEPSPIEPESPKGSFEEYGDLIGPDDEIEENATPAASVADPSELIAFRSASRDDYEEKSTSRSQKTERSKFSGISIGSFAKKIAKVFRKKNSSGNSDGTPREEPDAPLANDQQGETLGSDPKGESRALGSSTTSLRPKKEKPLWKSAVDPKTGRTYWYNRITRKSTYNPPPEALAQTNSISNPRSSGKSVDKPSENLPEVKKQKPKPMWKAVVDKNSGRTYYYHRKTRVTTWHMPDELKEFEGKNVEKTKDRYRGTEKKETLKDAAVETSTEEASKTAESIPVSFVQAALTEESHAHIHNGEQSLLEQSFDTQRHQNSFVNDRTDFDEFRIDEIPFDEPIVDVGDIPMESYASPSRLHKRSGTFMSKASAATKSSHITDKTERINNTRVGNERGISPINENNSTTTSISSNHVDTRLNTEEQPYLRERDLKIEDLTECRVAAETFDRTGRIVQGQAQESGEETDEASYYGDNEVDTYGDDSVSALSENVDEFSHRKENFEQARRRALDDAIEREDWDLAAALSEGMRATNTTGDYARAHTSWNPSELDKFIAQNDWEAVKSYIARMRNAKQDGHDMVSIPLAQTRTSASEPAVGALAAQRNNLSCPPTMEESRSFPSKVVGSRSQVQHWRLNDETSLESDCSESEEDSHTEFSRSLDEDTYDSDSS